MLFLLHVNRCLIGYQCNSKHLLGCLKDFDDLVYVVQMEENLPDTEELLIGRRYPQLPELSKMASKCLCISVANLFQWTQKALKTFSVK